MGLGAVVKIYEVVMATCNGARYLDQQITSILDQTLLPTRLLVADDASTDRTLECLAGWRLRSKVSIELLPPLGSGRLGCSRNFERLFQASTAPYVMLADQDDIWDRDKAERLLEEMGRFEQCTGSEGPLLVHADLRLIDSEGHVLERSFRRRQGFDPTCQDFLEIGLYNVVTGCAVLVNRACLNQALPFPAEVVLHDWWLALVAAHARGISYLPEPCLSYRQHSTNLVGAAGWRFLLHSHIRHALAGRPKAFAAELISPGLLQLQACVTRLGPETLAVQLERLWSGSCWVRLHTALGLGLRKQGLWRTAGFYVALLMARPLGR